MRARAFVDYTRAGPLKWLVVVAELDDQGGDRSVAHVASCNTKKQAIAHAKRVETALRFRPRKVMFDG